jgi:hypothetical protein
VDGLGVADQLEGGQAGRALQVEGADLVLVPFDRGQDQVADPLDPGQPVGQLAGLGQVEGDALAVPLRRPRPRLGPLAVAAGQHDLAALAA